ncbi:MAG: ABC transporter permease [Chloroflexota bacterium]|nr:ABC transporter permease [Chloroflexota bacterium]
MTNFFVQSYLTYRALFFWLNWPAYTGNVFLVPVLYITMLMLTGRFAGSPLDSDYYTKGMAAYSTPFILIWGITQCNYYERVIGTLAHVLGSSGNRWLIYWSRGTMHFPNGMFTVTSSLLFAWVFIGLDFSTTNWPTLIASILLIGFSCTSFALCVGVFAIVVRDWLVISAAASGLLILFTGVVVPVDELPFHLGYLGDVLPLTHGVAAFREAFLGASPGAVGSHLLWELAVGICYGLLGYLCFRLVEVDARRRGAYETSIL